MKAFRAARLQLWDRKIAEGKRRRGERGTVYEVDPVLLSKCPPPQLGHPPPRSPGLNKLLVVRGRCNAYHASMTSIEESDMWTESTLLPPTTILKVSQN